MFTYAAYAHIPTYKYVSVYDGENTPDSVGFLVILGPFMVHTE